MNLIVNVDRNWGIGKNDKLLFHLPDDMKFFVQKTTGKTVVMGRKTFLSLPGAKPLKNRRNIVLSKETGFNPDGVEICRNFDELFDVISSDEAFVIGGAKVYNALLPYCEKAFVTHVDAHGDADTHITNIAVLPSWTLVSESEVFENNGVKFKFCEYINKNILKWA